MADKGKIHDKPPVFNDILTFLWCKMKLCLRDTLLQVTKTFYKREEVIAARDVLYDICPSTDGQRRIKHRKSEDDLISMYNVLQEIDTENAPVFATINLNNIPYVDMKNVDGISLMYKQSKMQDQLQEMLHQQEVMQTQLNDVINCFQKKEKSVKPRVGKLSGPNYYSEVVSCGLTSKDCVSAEGNVPSTSSSLISNETSMRLGELVTFAKNSLYLYDYSQPHPLSGFNTCWWQGRRQHRKRITSGHCRRCTNFP